MNVKSYVIHIKARAVKKQCFLNYKSWFKEDGGIDIKLSYYITKYYAKLVYGTEGKRYPTAELFFRENSHSIATHVDKIKDFVNNEIVNYLCSLDQNTFDRLIDKSNKKKNNKGQKTMESLPLNDKYLKVHFKIGCKISESMWAKVIDSQNMIFELANSPFCFDGINYKDKFIAHLDDDNNLSFSRIYSLSGHSTFRVKNANIEYLQRLIPLNATYEYISSLRLCSIDVPPNVNIEPIIHFLKDGVKNGLWTFEQTLSL